MTGVFSSANSHLPADQTIVVLTGAELRHTFFRKRLALFDDIKVLQSFCEGTEKSIGAVVEREQENRLRLQHLRAREQSEEDFFRLFVETSRDASNPTFLPKGKVNDREIVERIIMAKPDFIVAYGCSIIRAPLLASFPNRIINVHLGLSPCYRGSGTNFWPLVNREPEFVGATFMYMDAGVDTGEIIHQLRARIASGDTAVQIGNRLIVDMARVCHRIVARHGSLKQMPQPSQTPGDRYYRKKDYTEASVATLYSNFAGGMIGEYLRAERERCKAAPILENPGL